MCIRVSNLWIQIRIDVLSVLIWVQTVYKGLSADDRNHCEQGKSLTPKCNGRRNDFISIICYMYLSNHQSLSLVQCTCMGGSRGGKGVWTPLKNHKNIGFLSNTGSDPLENHIATKPALAVGPPSVRQRNAILMVFR